MKMKRLLITAMFVLFGSQASAWVSKGFKPNKVSQIAIVVQDDATNGCWTNIGEVKRYAEDKLELAGHNVYRKRKDGWVGYRHYKLAIQIISNRTPFNLCFGAVRLLLYKANKTEDIAGLFTAGELHMPFVGKQNLNQYVLEKVGDFMEQVEDPQW